MPEALRVQQGLCRNLHPLHVVVDADHVAENVEIVCLGLALPLGHREILRGIRWMRVALLCEPALY